MPEPALSGSEFKKQLHQGTPKVGLFLNSHSPHCRRANCPQRLRLASRRQPSTAPWTTKNFVDALRASPAAAQNPSSASAGTTIVPASSRLSISAPTAFSSSYINTAEEARQAISCTKYPTVGTRSVYFPQRSMNKAGLLGYAGNFNKEGIICLQVETASCIENIAEIAAVPGVDILFLGQNDLCMSMGLFNKYEFPLMYTSPELDAATKKLIEHRPQE